MLPADSPFAALPAPGPHPATTELRAYAAGTLDAAAQYRIEAHMLDCERCADLVDGFLMTDAATTDQAVATLRARLQARLGEAVPVPPVPYWSWPRVAAAAALVGLMAGSLWTWEHRPTTPPATTRHQTSRPAEAVPAPAPHTAPTVAATVATTAKTTSESLKKADYAVAVSARPPRRAVPHRNRPTAARRPGKQPRRLAAISPLVAAANAPAEILTTIDTASAPSGQRTAGGIPAAIGAPPTPAASAASPKKAAGIAATDTTAPPPGAAVASRPAAAKPRAADNAGTVRVANTRMPVAIAINPVPVGGSSALRDYLRRAAIEFEPETPLQIGGSVRVRFTVEADGKLSNLRVVRGMRPDYDAEALRIVCDGPAWRPGVSGGRRAPLPMEVSVLF